MRDNCNDNQELDGDDDDGDGDNYNFTTAATYFDTICNAVYNERKNG